MIFSTFRFPYDNKLNNNTDKDKIIESGKFIGYFVKKHEINGLTFIECEDFGFINPQRFLFLLGNEYRMLTDEKGELHSLDYLTVYFNTIVENEQSIYVARIVVSPSEPEYLKPIKGEDYPSIIINSQEI